MKYAVAYSFGKDSTLAMDKIARLGGELVCLVVAYNDEAKRSWFHGINPILMAAISDSLGLPVVKAVCRPDSYDSDFEAALCVAREIYGAECCIFGDIDIAQHRQWDEERARAAGLEPVFPLWQAEREACAREFIDRGYIAVVKCINNTLLPKSVLGQVLSAELLAEFTFCGIDLCGENGEYHTVALGGKLFRYPIDFALGESFEAGSLSCVDVVLKSK